MTVLSDPAPPKTRTDLEWDRVLEALAERCAGPMGQAAARSLAFAATRDEVLVRLEESREATRLLTAGEPLPVNGVSDVTEPLDRLRVGGVLGALELRAIAQMLAAARTLRKFLRERRGTLPKLTDALSTDPTLDGIEEEIAAAFDVDGTLSDRASPTLKELRSQQQAARTRMLSRLDDLMTRYDRVLQDRYVTEREGRYVIPVRSDAHERFPGIVHATSASGSTIFVEPRAVIPMGNRLKMLEADVAREELAIYTRLSAVVSSSLPSVVGCADAMTRADVLSATARLAEDLALAFPRVVDDARLDLRAARHPLLVLDLEVGARDAGGGRGRGERPEGVVIPSDLAISSGAAVIVSGPNAGGKTVALKTLGLCALMLRAGLPLPCTEGSTAGIFDVVLTDVGDDQNLSKSLSTFSAHVTNVRTILEETHPGALVLLDELAGGTDPREGEALAAGILDSLCARGGAVVATTHYEGLKALALADPRFQNASVGFDLKAMLPTFRLALGVPGSSSALAVARRFGMPSTVIARAESFLSREDQNFETVVKRLNDERAALELARAAAEQREKEAEEARRRLEEEIERTKQREGRIVSREAQTLLESVRRAKEDLRAAQARLRQKKLEDHGVREAERVVDRIASSVAVGGELEHLLVREGPATRSAVRPEALRKGARVWVPRLRAEAEVVEVGSGGVRIAAGPLKMTVAIEDLRSADEPQAPASPSAAARTRESNAQTSSATPTRIREDLAIQTSDNTCDLRGLRVDDALSMATQFLDRALNARLPVVFLLHGHGTGALRESLRRELKSSPYVAHLRPGAQGEGGDGVTVVWLT